MNITKYKYLFIILLLAQCIPAFAQPVRTGETIHPGGKLAFQTTMQKAKPFIFMENKGQLSAQSLKGVNSISDVQYYGSQGGVNIYCKNDRIAFVFTKAETDKKPNFSKAGRLLSPAGGGRGWKNHDSVPKPSTITAARMEMQFINSNTSVQIINDERQSYYENYYTTGDADHGITNVQAYKKLTYKSLWPNIDLVLKANQKNGMEYSFLVYPGGNIKDIQIQWNGADSINMLENKMGIRYSNNLGSIQEVGLKTYLGDAKESVTNRYVFGEGNRVGFDVKEYNKNQVLVIDPTLVWGTYYGGTNFDEAYGVSTDDSKNGFITGVTNSRSSIATLGAFQTSFMGINDAFVAKFDSGGVMSWATYFGGDNEVEGYGVSALSSGNIFIVGETNSSNIATSNAFQTSFSAPFNGENAFLAKFNNQGILNWATYYGGHGGLASALSTDLFGNVYITGTTTSLSGIATSGAYQTSLGGNVSYDAFLAKFSDSGRRLWATYYGGSNNDEGEAVCTDKLGNVYITGYASSNGLATLGSYQSFDAGGYYDAFLVKFDSSGTRLWATYFGGDSTDYGTGLSTDAQGNVYLTGETYSANNIATSGAYQKSLSGYIDAFLAKFSSSGHLFWTTYFGGSGYLNNGRTETYGVSTDLFDNVYITGSTNSRIGIVTSNAYQKSFGGNYDAFLSKFNSSGNLIWSSYYGGSGDDYAIGIRTDNFENIYITGYTNSDSNISTLGSYQSNYGGSTYDAFLAKFSFKIKYDASIISILNPNGNFCTGTKPLIVNLINYGTSKLDSVKINWTINGKLQHQYNWTGKLQTDSSTIVTVGNYTFNPGIDTIKAWTSLPDGFKDSIPENDSSMVVDTVYAPPIPQTGGNHSICFGDKVSLGATPINGHSYKWTSSTANGVVISTLSNPIVSPAINTTYYLTESITGIGCSNVDSVVITVNPLPNPKVTNSNKTICIGSKINLGVFPAIAGHTYNWHSYLPGFSSNMAQTIDSPKTNIRYSLKETINFTGCTKTDSAFFKVVPLPNSLIIGDPDYCEDTSIRTFRVDSLPSATYGWKWQIKGGSIVSGQGTIQIKARLYDGIDTVSVIDSNANGCIGTNSEIIQVNKPVNPHFKVIIDSPNYIFKATDTSGKGYTWSFGDGTYGDSDAISHHYTFLKDSMVKVSLRVTNVEGDCAFTFDTIIKIHYFPGPQFNIWVFPNPFENQSQVKIELGKAAHIQIVVYDAIGRRIANLVDAQQPIGDQSYVLDANKYQLSDGVYFLRIEVDDKVYVRAVLRQ